MERSRKYPWFVRGDLDGFFGLAVDNLVQVLVIVALCKLLCGFTDELIYTRMLPAIAVSLIIGNLFYAWHARRVAKRDGNPTCTALPYGINTPSVFAYILFIMAPVWARTHDMDLVWKLGIIACIGSGIIELLGAFIGGWIRRVTPRAALLSALAAIAIIFIASPFAFQIFERPLVAIIPMFVVLIGYFAKVRFPLGLPSGLVAIILGTILAWTVPAALGLVGSDAPAIMSADAVGNATQWFYSSADGLQVHWPKHCWSDIVAFFQQDTSMLWAFLGVIVPMGLINAIGSLQNIESAEAAGDRFSTGPCMAVNGIGSIAAGLFGSCFPTTIYIGHPGWKALGARYGYSIINALFFSFIFIFGLGSIVVSVIPMEAGMAIVMWIGIIITAQSYEAVPKCHYPAVAIAFFPAVAMMAIFLIPQILQGIGAEHGIASMFDAHGAALGENRTDAWWPIGVYALAGANSGFIITGIIIAAVSAFLIDRKFKNAAVWCVVAALVTLLGFQHAYRIEPDREPPGTAAEQLAAAEPEEGPTTQHASDGPVAAETREITTMPRELLVWQRSEEAFKGTSLYLEKRESAFWHRGYRIAAAYAVAAGLLLLIYWMRRRGKAFEDIVPADDAGAGYDGPGEMPRTVPGTGPPVEVPDASALPELAPPDPAPEQ